MKISRGNFGGLMMSLRICPQQVATFLTIFWVLNNPNKHSHRNVLISFCFVMNTCIIW